MAVKDFSNVGYVAAVLAVLTIAVALAHRVKVLREEHPVRESVTDRDEAFSSRPPRRVVRTKRNDDDHETYQPKVLRLFGYERVRGDCDGSGGQRIESGWREITV